MAHHEEIDKGLNTMRMIWLAMLLSLAVYAGIAPIVLAGVAIDLPPATLTMVRTGGYLLALLTLMGSRLIYSRMLSAKAVRSTEEAGAGVRVAVQRATAAMVVALALSEAIGIDGLILFLLGRNPMDLYLLLLVAVAAMVLAFPKREEVLGLAESMRRL